MVRFFASSASVSVMRPLASSVFGSYSLSIPDDLDPEDFHQFDADGNELGYVAQLRPEVRTGGFARRFVRADVSVTAEDPRDPIEGEGASDVDEVLTDTRDRVSDDFFLESSVDAAGLGPWVPYEDFKVGDRVEVEIYGLVVVLVVTRIEPVVSDHNIVDWVVHVGGQILDDEKARLAANKEVYDKLIADRRDLAGLAAKTQKEVSAAQAAADAAAEAAREALENADLILENYIVGPDGLQAQVGTIQQDVTDALEASNDALAQLETLPAELMDQAQKDFRETLNQELGTLNQALTDAEKRLSEAQDEVANDLDKLDTRLYGEGGTISTLSEEVREAWNRAAAVEAEALTSTVIEYAVNTSRTSAPTTGWSTSTPTPTAGQQVWMRAVNTYGDDNVVTTNPALITGNTGEPGKDGSTGKDGADGQPGKDGVGLEDTTVTYVVSTSGTTTPGSGWSTSVPTLTKGRYLWTRTAWKYSDNSTEYGYSVAYIAKDGSDGTDGLPGKDGTTLTSTSVTYAKSSSGTSVPSSGWTTTVPSATPGEFIWTKTTWSYSDGTDETAYSVGKIGDTGDTGAQGVSLSSLTPFYRFASSKPSVPSGTGNPTGWSTTEPNYVKGQTLWRTERMIFSNGIATWTPVSAVSALEAMKAELDAARTEITQEITTSANGKNTITRSNADPSGNGKREGDIWWRIDGDDHIIGQWTWNGSAWKITSIDSEVIANLDVGKLTAGSVRTDEAVVNKIWADGIAAKSITSSRLLVTGDGNLLPEVRSYAGMTELERGSNADHDPYREFGLNTGDPSIWAMGSRTKTVWQPIQLTAGEEYLFEFDVKATVANTRFYWLLHKGTIDGPNEPRVSLQTKIDGATRTYLFGNEEIPPAQTWQHFEVTFTVDESAVGWLYLYPNHSRGADNDDGYQWFKNMRLWKRVGATLIEDGAITTDKIAANAVTANEIAANAITAEKIQAGSIKADRIEANAFASIGPSLLVNVPGTLTPQWTTAGFQLYEDHSWVTGRPEAGPHVHAKNQDRDIAVTNPTPVRVISGQKYEFDFWAIGLAGSRILIRLTKAGVNAGAIAAHGELDGNEGKIRTGTTWGIWVELTEQTQWQRFRGWVEFDEDTEHVVLDQIEWHQGGTGLGQYQMISGLEINALMPDQAEIDALQNQAIRNTNRSVGLQQRSVQALAVGENLLPYYEPTPAEVEDGYSTWLMPDWAQHAVDTGTDDSVYPGFRWYSYDRTRTGGWTRVPVDSSIEYEFVVWMKGDIGSRVFIELRDQDGNHAVKTGAITTQARPVSPVFNESTGRMEDVNTRSRYLVENFEFEHDQWSRYTTRVTLNSGVKEVRIGSIYGSHSNGTPGTAYIGEDMRFRPWNATPAQVEGIQNYAISTNTTAVNANTRAINANNQAIRTQRELTDDMRSLVSQVYGATVTASGSSSDRVTVSPDGNYHRITFRPGPEDYGNADKLDIRLDVYKPAGADKFVFDKSEIWTSYGNRSNSTWQWSINFNSPDLLRITWSPSTSQSVEFSYSGSGTAQNSVWLTARSVRISSQTHYIGVEYDLTWVGANNNGGYLSAIQILKPNGTDEWRYVNGEGEYEYGIGPFLGDAPRVRSQSETFSGNYPSGTLVRLLVATSNSRSPIFTTHNRSFTYTMSGYYSKAV